MAEACSRDICSCLCLRRELVANGGRWLQAFSALNKISPVLEDPGVTNSTASQDHKVLVGKVDGQNDL
jgi:hypothetical protein